jgi:hypothetical protein
MEKLIAFVIAALFVIGIMFVVYGGIWWLWCAIVPQLWASGPEGIIRPSFWLFVGAWILLSLIGKAIFGNSSK